MKIKDICTSITDGSHNPPQGVESSDYLMLSSKNVFDDEITFDDPRYLDEFSFKAENKRTRIQPGDVLLTIVGTVGRVAVVPENIPNITLQRSVAVLHTNPMIILPRFLMYALLGKRSNIERWSKGVAQKGIYLGEVSEIDIGVPSIPVQKDITERLDLVKRIIKMRQQELSALDDLIKARFVRMAEMNYKVIDRETYYRKGVFRHFTEDCKCSTSITSRIDVTELVTHSKNTGTKFYINFLYILSKVMNSREDYRMGYLWQTNELICYDVINPTQYVFHEDTETCTPVYTKYDEDYEKFYAAALRDVEAAKKTREYGLDMTNHPNWFDASYISWLSYDSLHLELPDGNLYFAPIINWGKYREETGRFVMPVTVRLNHAIADGYLVANVFRLLEKEINYFVGL